jgi:hypothetical protein
MPFRLGFIQYRLQLLRQELERLLEELPALGALKVILIGDLLTDNITPSSIIDLIIVHDTDLSYLDRIDFFISHLRPIVGVQISALTPSEYSGLESTNLTLFNKIDPEQILYES